MGRPKTSDQKKTRLVIAFITGLCLTVTLISTELNRANADDQGSAEAGKAFLDASAVLFHPRCLNCHPAGDAPLIQNTSQSHLFNVKRGPEGKGIGALNCTLCHRDANQPEGPPGVPNWHMPPESMPMTFQGRTPGQLCRQLKDPRQNGGRTGEQIITHIDKDPLVRWGWNPGNARSVPPLSYEEFAAKMHAWYANGCACPE